MTYVHDKTNTPQWIDKVSSFIIEFDHNDRVIHHDPQDRLGRPTFVVSRIDHHNEHEHIQQLGLFWKHSEAMNFATADGAEMV